jgi:hypothetical protein
MNMKSHQFSRRAFLRGTGVSMALPWMESVNVWGDEPKKEQACQRGAGAALRDVFRQRLSVEGMVGEGRGQGDGVGQGADAVEGVPREAALCARPVSRGGAEGEHPLLTDGQHALRSAHRERWEIRSGTSFDQMLAQTYGRSTKVPSLVLACEKSNPSVHKNYSMLYSSHISWSFADHADAAGALSRARL